MTVVLIRRKSMSLLTLYDLDSFLQPKQVFISTEKEDQCSMKKTSIKSVFESLPNEILLYIFEFLSAYDLHRSIWNLNSRLNNLYHTQKFSVDLTSSKDLFDYYCSNQQSFFSQTYSMTLGEHYNRLKWINEHIHMDRLVNLRRLTIKEAASENFDRILSKFHLLPCLSYLDLHYVTIQSPHILTSIFSIKSLRHLVLYSFDPILLQFPTNLIQPFCHLEYLSIESCYIIEFLQLLQYVGPSLKKLNISRHYQRSSNSTVIDPLIIDELLSNPNTPKFVRHLTIGFDFPSLTDFHLFLSLFSHVTHLTFSVSTDELDFISASTWHSFISSNLLELKKLQFYIRILHYPGYALQRPSTDLVDRFYEMHKKWLVGPLILDYNALLRVPLSEFYTYTQTRRGRKSSLEFYGKERYVSKTMLDDEINIDENITYLYVTLSDHPMIINGGNQPYPKVRAINIHSRMTLIPMEIDSTSKLICNDLLKSLGDLSKITTLSFTTDLSMHAVKPSATLARRLFNQFTEVTSLRLSYSYLLSLLRSPLIVQMLRKQITSLSIQFHNHLPVVEDMLDLVNIFSSKLHFLYLELYVDLVPDDVYRLLPLLFSDRWKKLYNLHLELSNRQLQRFSESFKKNLENYFNEEINRRGARSNTMEYGITDNQFSVSF